MFGVYQPNTVNGQLPEAIYVLYPTPHQNTALFVLGTVFPVVSGVGCGVSSGVLRQRGFGTASHILEIIQFSNWFVTFWVVALSAFYFGLKFSAVLKAYVLETEAKLGEVPEKGFGISNLRSESPARYLYIMLKLTTFGACGIFALAGSLCGLWAWDKDRILRSETPFWPHVMAVIWMCANGLSFIVKLLLIAFHSRLTTSGEYKLLNSLLPRTPVVSDTDQHVMVRLQSPWQPASCSNSLYTLESARADLDTWREYDQKTSVMTIQDIQWVEHDDMMSAATPGTTLTLTEHSACPGFATVIGPISAAQQDRTRHFSGSGQPLDERLRTQSFRSRLSSSVPSAPMPAHRVPEFQSLCLQYRSVLKQMQELECLHQREEQHPPRLQRLRDLQQQVKELNQHMRQLETFHNHFLQSQIHLQKSRRPDAAAVSKDTRIRSNMVLLQQQVDFSLRIIKQEMEFY
ncbi:hypothetical protein BGZ72_009886 [Mortierella alpina]|nr:hypothetical protein BGZ72_009886 [Mortierella alpina]